MGAASSYEVRGPHPVFLLGTGGALFADYAVHAADDQVPRTGKKNKKKRTRIHE